MTPPDTAPDAAASQTDTQDPRPTPIRTSNERKGNPVTCPECGVEVTHIRRHLKRVHPAAGAAPPPKRASRSGEARSGELWAKCPECRVPVKDVELFKHLLNCPGADVRRAEWAAQQAIAAINPAAVEPEVQQ